MRVLYTSALIPYKFEERKKEYEDGYKSFLNFFNKEEITIVECFSESSDFLSNFGSEIFYTKTHNNQIRNKGVLEISAISNFLNNSNIKEEVILKTTGRYQLNDDVFINQIKNNPGFDFYGKLIDNDIQVFTGFFAIKTNVLIDFSNSINLDDMEKKEINLEKMLLDYLRAENKNCFYVKSLGMTAPIFGTGDVQIHLV